jgi:hypothetical protein
MLARSKVNDENNKFVKTIDKCIVELLSPEKKKIIQALESYKNKFYVFTIAAAILPSKRREAIFSALTS